MGTAGLSGEPDKKLGGEVGGMGRVVITRDSWHPSKSYYSCAMEAGVSFRPAEPSPGLTVLTGVILSFHACTTHFSRTM